MRSISTLRKECLLGKSLLRTLHNLHLSKIKKFEGHGIDFGSDGTSSYYRFINLEKEKMTFVDLYKNNDKTISVDFENDFDFSEQKFDFALLFNILEHIYNHKKFLKNVNNSIVDGGRIEGFVPFLHHFHGDPNDYFRYTHTTIRKLLEESNFQDIEITKIGIGGFTVCASLISRILKFKNLVFLSWLISLNLDKLLSKVWKTNRDIYTGISFSAKKLP